MGSMVNAARNAMRCVEEYPSWTMKGNALAACAEATNLLGLVVHGDVGQRGMDSMIQARDVLKANIEPNNERAAQRMEEAVGHLDCFLESEEADHSDSPWMEELEVTVRCTRLGLMSLASHAAVADLAYGPVPSDQTLAMQANHVRSEIIDSLGGSIAELQGERFIMDPDEVAESFQIERIEALDDDTDDS